MIQDSPEIRPDSPAIRLLEIPTRFTRDLHEIRLAGIYFYVENYGRYDWTRYFGGHAGLDLRWTVAKQRMWKVRLSTGGRGSALSSATLLSSGTFVRHAS